MCQLKKKLYCRLKLMKTMKLHYIRFIDLYRTNVNRLFQNQFPTEMLQPT